MNEVVALLLADEETKAERRKERFCFSSARTLLSLRLSQQHPEKAETVEQNAKQTASFTSIFVLILFLTLMGISRICFSLNMIAMNNNIIGLSCPSVYTVWSHVKSR